MLVLHRERSFEIFEQTRLLLLEERRLVLRRGDAPFTPRRLRPLRRLPSHLLQPPPAPPQRGAPPLEIAHEEVEPRQRVTEHGARLRRRNRVNRRVELLGHFWPFVSGRLIPGPLRRQRLHDRVRLVRPRRPRWSRALVLGRLGLAAAGAPALAVAPAGSGRVGRGRVGCHRVPSVSVVAARHVEVDGPEGRCRGVLPGAGSLGEHVRRHAQIPRQRRALLGGLEEHGETRERAGSRGGNLPRGGGGGHGLDDGGFGYRGLADERRGARGAQRGEGDGAERG